MSISSLPSAECAADEPPRGSALETLLEQSEATRRSGDHHTGAKLSRQAAELALREGDAPRRTHALRLLSLQLFRLGDFEEGARVGQLAVQLLRELGDRGGLSDALGVLAMCYGGLGLSDEATKAVTESLDLAQQVGDAKLLFWAYNRIGIAHDALGDWEQAQKFFLHALPLAEQIADNEALFSVLNNLANSARLLARSYLETGRADAAQALLQRDLPCSEAALRAARGFGNPYRECIALANYGMLRGLAGDYEAASTLLQQARDLATAHGYRPLQFEPVLNLAELAFLRGEPHEAVRLLEEVRRTVPTDAERTVLLELYRQLYRTYKSIGAFGEALDAHERYYVLERERSSKAAEVRARMLMNRLELDNAKLEAERAQLEAQLQRVRSAELEAEKRALEARTLELDRYANEDQLTRLWNRRYIDAVLPVRFEGAKAGGTTLAVAMCDIDHFKSINDRFGHLTGDAVLESVASILKNSSRPTDTVARIGGEEFLLLLYDTPLAGALVVCERLRAWVEAYPWEELERNLRITISFGVADSVPVQDYHALLRAADAALYRAKHNGRNRVEPMQTGS